MIDGANNSAPEFSRGYRLDTIGTVPQSVTIDASADECAALAVRFGLVAIDVLSATAVLVQSDDATTATGTLSARVTQTCIGSGDDVPARVDEAFTIRFVADLASEASADEMELLETQCDTVEHDGHVVDLGEAVAQTLALALDPFPRSLVAAAALKAAGVVSEDEVGSAAFAGLKNLLKG